MPGWMLAGLTLARGLAVGARGVLFGTPARAALTGAGAGALVQEQFGGVGAGIPGIDIFPDGGVGAARRRRRRRALSQGDRDDIAFIAATISNAAAGKFAVMLATRAR